jgi:hypothetical protein
VVRIDQAGAPLVSVLRQTSGPGLFGTNETGASNAPRPSCDTSPVSACFRHVLTYPEPAFGRVPETGSMTCPAAPSPSNPCTLAIRVNTADVGSPTNSSLLESVGTYALAFTVRWGEITNAGALADNVPLEVEGVCCFNFSPSAR